MFLCLIGGLAGVETLIEKWWIGTKVHTNPFIFLHHKHLATNEKYKKKYETRNNVVDGFQDNEIVPILRARLNDAIRDFTLHGGGKKFHDELDKIVTSYKEGEYL